MKSINQASIKGGAITKSITQRIASNFGWSVVSEAIGKGAFFVTNIYLARTLGVESFGLFTLAQTITFYFWLAVDLGTNMYGVREIAKNKEHVEEIINPLLTLRMTAGFIVFSLYALSLVILHIPDTKRLIFAGCGLYLLTYAFYTDWVLKGLERFKFIAFGSLVSSIIFLVGTFYFVTAKEDVILASFIWSLSYLFGSLSLFYCLCRKLEIKYRPYFNFEIWFWHIRESIYFTISGSLMVLYQYFPILLLSIFYTTYEVGLFAAPYRVVTTICGAGFLLPMAFYPVFSELYQKNKVEFSRIQRNFRRFMVGIGCIAAILGLIFSGEAMRFLFGKQYGSSIGIFRIAIFLVPLNFLRYTYGTLLQAAGFQRYHIIGALCGLVSMLVSGLPLIIWKSTLGAAVSLIVSEAFMITSFFTLSNYVFRRT